MKTTRRAFLQFSLVLALPALAGETVLRGELRKQDDGTLDLELENVSPAPLDVLLFIGSRPAVELEGLVPVAPQEEDFRNRAGPRHVWRPLAPGERVAAGSFRCERPVSSSKGRVRTARGYVELLCSL